MTSMTTQATSYRPDTPASRTLVLASWKANPDEVVAACARQYVSHPTTFALVVPATLHGIDWVGDPYANVPCARRALSEIARRLNAAALPLHCAELGDHDPVAAVTDALLNEETHQILVCEPKQHLRPALMDLAHRARRVSGLPVSAIPVAPAAERRPRRLARLWRGECAAPQARPLRLRTSTLP